METKKCPKCKISKKISEFNWRNRDKGVRQGRCRICTRITTKAHYQDNKTVYKKRAVEFSRKKRDDNRRLVVEYLEDHPCVDCGENDPIVLQFDHVSGDKKKSVSRLAADSYSWETVEKEISKCEIRCANCHTRKTAKQFSWRFKGA